MEKPDFEKLVNERFAIDNSLLKGISKHDFMIGAYAAQSILSPQIEEQQKQIEELRNKYNLLNKVANDMVIEKADYEIKIEELENENSKLMEKLDILRDRQINS